MLDMTVYYITYQGVSFLVYFVQSHLKLEQKQRKV